MIGKKSLARNPNICALLNQVNYIEKMGTGISRMRKLMQENNLPEIQFEYSEFFTLKIERKSRVNPLESILQISTKRADKMLEILKDLHINKEFSVDQISAKLSVSNRSVRDDLGALSKHKLISTSGKNKNRKYQITKQGIELLK